MTQPSQANPHRIFLAPFQPPVRNPQETPGKPKETLTVAAETRRQPPSNCPRAPFAPLQGFLFTLHRAFRFFRAHYLARQHFPGKPAWRAEDVMPPGTQDPLAWHPPSPLLTSRHLWESSPRGGDPIGSAGRCLSRSAKVSSRKSASQLPSSPGFHVTVSLRFLCSPTSPPYPLSPTHENRVRRPGVKPGSHRWQ